MSSRLLAPVVAGAALITLAAGCGGGGGAPARTKPLGTNQPAIAPAGFTGAGSGTTIPAGITVTGVGLASGTPDTANLQMHVDVTRSSVGEALDTANGAAGAVQAALAHDGVSSRDLATSGLSLNPSYDSHGNVIGYEVTESITAQLRSLRNAGRTIGDAVAAGGPAVRVDNLSLDIEQDSGLLAVAREAAFQDAHGKAAQYAQLAGRTLGPVESISEVVATPYPQSVGLGQYNAGAAASSAVPIQPGSQNLSITVTVVYGLL
ncbi:MAG TPA: SIMPL domain-containing protein [Mycobacteriales bacterium]|nr:SIMPL domain-containing protein [Mycobacteriales bacterium]